MARADDRIDELYQLPLDEFTPARNALAKELGDGGIKKLEKPNVAAWAVNQLYWRERKLYDEVIKTAEQLRTAYKQMLAGKPADVRAVEVFHNEAMRRAKDAIRRMLAEAGNKGADAVMMPIVETLDALPTADAAGPLDQAAASNRLRGAAGRDDCGQAEGGSRRRSNPKKTPAEKETEKDRRKREADQQELLMAKERLRFAEAAEREAEASLDRAKRTLERAERTRERIEGELEEASIAEKGARKELSAAESSYAKAKAERDRLEKKIRG